MKTTRLSHSALSKYQECPKAFDFHYNQKLVSKYKHAALYFGSALDLAINDLLEKKPMEQARETFIKNWKSGRDNENRYIDLTANEDIVYSESDFDKDLLEELIKDFDENLYDSIMERKSQVGWSNLEVKDRKYVNKWNWLSLRKKGLIMLDAYQEQVIPKFKEVLGIQKYVKLENEDSDSIIGYIDLIVRLHDNRVVIIDNKTAGREYDSDAVTKSPQLSIYKTILNDAAASETDEWEHHIDAAGFAVLLKNVTKNINKTCKSCGFKAEKGSTHKTCYNEISKKRCGGEWDRKVSFKGESQFLIDEIPEHVQEMVLENVNIINQAIKNEQYPRNFGACKTKYGGFCPYYAKCWMQKDDDLIKINKKD